MVIRKSSEIASSEITPKPVYLNRRNFMMGSLALGAAALAGHKLYRAFAPEAAQRRRSKLQYQKSGFSTSEKLTPLNDMTHYNNFYEFSTDKDGPAQAGGLVSAAALERLRRRPGAEAEDLRHGCVAEARPVGRAHLPPALCRRLVDGDPVDRVSAERADQAGRAHRQGAVRRVHHGSASQSDARPKARRARLAVCRRFAARRGDESAGDSCGGALRRDAAQPGRRADTAWWSPGSMASRAPSPSSRSSS